MISDLLVLAPAAFVLLVLLVWRAVRPARPRPRDTESQDTPVPANAIVVDGSNVMHWGGEPSVKVLSRVMRALEQQGFAPIVFFDANAGYKLGDCYHDEVMLSRLMHVTQKHICVAHAGVVADEWILDFATKHDLRVVSNDRYRDWSNQFHFVKDHRRFLRGTWRDGNVVWGKQKRA